MATIYFGMCHTFTYKNEQNTDEITNIFPLVPTLNYKIFIHDPKFYHILIKSQFPRIHLEYKAGKDIEAGHYEWFTISLTEHHLLNRPKQACEEREDYDFLQCVKTSQARSVGCRPSWDIWSPHTIPLCQTMEQLNMYEKIDTDLLGIAKQKAFVRRTGCQVPCHYKVGEVLFGFLKIK